MVAGRASAHTMWHVEQPCPLVLARCAGAAELPTTLARGLKRGLWNPRGGRELHEVIEARQLLGCRHEAGGAIPKSARDQPGATEEQRATECELRLERKEEMVCARK